MSHSDSVEKTNFDKAQELLEKYAHPDAGVLADKIVTEIELLKAALTEEKDNATVAVASIHQTLVKLASEGKIKGRFVAGNENEFDYYQLESDTEFPITLVLMPSHHQYEWKFEEDLHFGVDTLPAFDILYKDLSTIKKTNLLNKLFNAAQADTRNPAVIEELDQLLAANIERKQKSLVEEWRETLEYVLADLKDEKSGKSILLDQLFPYTKNGKTKSYKIMKADRGGLVVMIDEELELDRKFPIDSYAYELIVAFMPLLVKHKGKSASTKQTGRSAKQKKADKPLEPTQATDARAEDVSPAPKEDQPLP